MLWQFSLHSTQLQWDSCYTADVVLLQNIPEKQCHIWPKMKMFYIEQNLHTHFEVCWAASGRTDTLFRWIERQFYFKVIWKLSVAWSHMVKLTLEEHFLKSFCKPYLYIRKPWKLVTFLQVPFPDDLYPGKLAQVSKHCSYVQRRYQAFNTSPCPCRIQMALYH